MYIESRKFIANAFQFVGYALWAPLFAYIYRHLINQEGFNNNDYLLNICSFLVGLSLITIGWYIIYTEEKQNG